MSQDQLGSWRVDLRQYDRQPHLSEEEFAAIDRLLRRFARRNGQWPAAVRSALQRLLHPVEDVLEAAAITSEAGHNPIRVLLREMHRRHTAYWTWSAADWQETLAASPAAFRQRWGNLVAYRQALILLAYHVGHFDAFVHLGPLSYHALATHVFGSEAVDLACTRVTAASRQWGNGTRVALRLHRPLYAALLLNRDPTLEALTAETLTALPAKCGAMPGIATLSKVFVSLKILTDPIREAAPVPCPIVSPASAARPDSGEWNEWNAWCQRWRDTATLAPSSRTTIHSRLRQVGHWLAREHPDRCSPDSWTRAFAAEFLGAVDRVRVGDWADIHIRGGMSKERWGTPYTARGKANLIGAVRQFLRDCQEWGWIPRRFDPHRWLATPRSIRALIAPDPRVIADDIWAKLLWSGLNLTADDLPARTSNLPRANGTPWMHYPLEMTRAIAMVWLFAGLRANEVARLRLGCVRWQHDAQREHDTQGERGEQGKQVGTARPVCLLDVPVNKTGVAFTKPVDRYVGEAIETWERARPRQPRQVDEKTGEAVWFLFSFRGIRIAKQYINDVLIPVLCRKTGVPEHDARGKITSHRARSTIASHLFNADTPMTLFELQEWLGHASPTSTQHYAKISPTKLLRSYAQAGYFERNRRAIEVLIDQEAVTSGRASQGEPWRFYDLGHGYCTYDFFEQCPHRMACAKCAFYQPKGSSQAQLLEAKSNPLRLKQEIPLTDEEAAAVDDGLDALAHLCDKLADIPTPSGPTPRQLAVPAKRRSPVISTTS